MGERERHTEMGRETDGEMGREREERDAGSERDRQMESEAMEVRPSGRWAGEPLAHRNQV